MEIITFSEPKIGESSRTNQDYFAFNPEGNLIALSDGAGSSLYPRQWAEILVNTFCRSAENPIEVMKQSHQNWLNLPRQQWQQYYIQKLTDSTLKWWQKGSELKNYGAATFLGLSLHFPSQQWQAVALGDSCLFKLTVETGDLTVFPQKTAEDFQSVTQCFISSPDITSFPPQLIEGRYQAGDAFLLATDALCQWILRNYENQGQDWQKCLTLRKSEEFSEMLTQLRQDKLIKNDDTTLMIIKVNE